MFPPGQFASPALPGTEAIARAPASANSCDPRNSLSPLRSGSDLATAGPKCCTPRRQDDGRTSLAAARAVPRLLLLLQRLARLSRQLARSSWRWQLLACTRTKSRKRKVCLPEPPFRSRPQQSTFHIIQPLPSWGRRRGESGKAARCHSPGFLPSFLVCDVHSGCRAPLLFYLGVAQGGCVCEVCEPLEDSCCSPAEIAPWF